MELERQMAMVTDIDKTFHKMAEGAKNLTQRVLHDNDNHRDKMRKMMSESKEKLQEELAETRSYLEESKVFNEKLKNQVENCSKSIKDIHVRIAESVTASEQCAIDCNSGMAQNLDKLKKDSELSLCNFTDNLVREIRYLNQRAEDKLLFKIGYYTSPQHNPLVSPTGSPREFPTIDIDLMNETLVKVDELRSRSVRNRTLDFDSAFDEASERTKRRLKKGIEASEQCDPFKEPEEIEDFEWEMARLQE